MGRGQQTPCAAPPSAGGSCTVASTTCWHGNATWGCPDGIWAELGGSDQHDHGQDAETPEHLAFVGGFGLDKFEVTVARMRAFVEAYDRTALLQSLAAGAGAHPGVSGSDWQSGWDQRLPDDRAALEDALLCDDPTQTWTATAGSNETFPINCLSWYLAYAFCAWDEGRLPTEAEWERAAAGGDQNRRYPWGETDPTSSLANYLEGDNTPFMDVSAKPNGAGRWEHRALAGSVWEWVLDLHDPDWYTAGGSDCRYCANLSGDGARTMRGGAWLYHDHDLRAARRFAGSSGAYWLGAGVRCARDN
jgi:formylglycine-generating enzyme required for sulfatase activity